MDDQDNVEKKTPHLSLGILHLQHQQLLLHVHVQILFGLRVLAAHPRAIRHGLPGLQKTLS